MESPLLRRLIFTTLLPLSTFACGGPGEPVAAPVPAREVGAFVVRLGADTVALEEFARTETGIEGRQLIRTPRTMLREYSATLRPDGTMDRFEMRVREAPGAEPTAQATIDFDSDPAVVRLTREGRDQTQRIDARDGAIPFLGYSVALYELPFARLRETEAEELETSMVPIGGAEAFPLRLERRGTDTILVHNLAGTSRARVDAQGRLLVWDGRGSTLDLTADRAVALDVDRYAREYAARDAEGRGLGTLSPRDSVAAQVGDATVEVAYGRPMTRGRQIFGNVVPWGEVWRTGANQATLLRTDRDLMIGETRVPAGEYSIFTIPSPDGWQLIVNRRTGEWGTEHDATHDLARIPMRSETLADRVERFTISIDPRGEAEAELRLAWDDTRASVPIRLP